MFQAGYKGKTDEALALLDRLVKITARTPDLRQKAIPLIKAGDVDKLRTLFERAYAQAIYKTLELAFGFNEPIILIPLRVTPS